MNIRELCAPLSAKVMPKAAKWNRMHMRMTDEEALRQQRNEPEQQRSARAQRAKWREGKK